MNPTCDLCGREMLWLDQSLDLDGRVGWVCPTGTPDQHRIAELESKLAAAEVREWELRQKLFRSDCKAMGEGWGHTLCAEQRDAAEAKVKELKSKLAEADFCIAWMADPGVGTDPRYMGRLANMRRMAAQDAAIEREAARKKGAEHE